MLLIPTPQSLEAIGPPAWVWLALLCSPYLLLALLTLVLMPFRKRPA